VLSGGVFQFSAQGGKNHFSKHTFGFVHAPGCGCSLAAIASRNPGASFWNHPELLIVSSKPEEDDRSAPDHGLLSAREVEG
jgi:hypothetical protein